MSNAVNQETPYRSKNSVLPITHFFRNLFPVANEILYGQNFELKTARTYDVSSQIAVYIPLYALQVIRSSLSSVERPSPDPGLSGRGQWEWQCEKLHTRVVVRKLTLNCARSRSQ